MTPAHHQQIRDLMEGYFEGLHQADSAKLRRVFHPRLAYVCATEGEELYLDLDSYMTRVDGRDPAALRGQPRADRLLEIAFVGDRLARVTARMSLMGRSYTDLLTVIREGADWRIVAKVFVFSPQET